MRVSFRVLGILAASVLSASACGAQPAAKASPSPPASGAAALDRFDKSTMQDGHERTQIHTSGGVVLTGEGWMSFRPHMAEYQLLTGSSNGSETYLEMLTVGSVNFVKSGSPAERSTARWERSIFDRLLKSPSQYLLGVPSMSGTVRSVVAPAVIGGTATWLVTADTPDGLQELWLRQSDYYLVQYRLTTPNGDVTTSTLDRYNIKPSLTVPSDAEVVDGEITCGFATLTDSSPLIGQRACGLEALGAPYELVDFTSTTKLPASLVPYVVDYAGNETRKNEGVTIESGAAVFRSESSEHEVDLVYRHDLADVIVVADFEQTGAADASMAGISLRCSESQDFGVRGCLAVAVRPDGGFLISEKASADSQWKTVTEGMAKVNAGKNRLVVWADGDQVGAALNGVLLGTFKTSVPDAASPYFFHESLSETTPSQVRLLSLGIYEQDLVTMADLMGP